MVYDPFRELTRKYSSVHNPIPASRPETSPFQTPPSTAHRRLTLGRGHEGWFVAPEKHRGPPYVFEPKSNATSPFPIMSYDPIRKPAKKYSSDHIPSPSQPLGNQPFPNATVSGPPPAYAWALTTGLVCRPVAARADRVAGGRPPRVALATSLPGRDFEWRCEEGTRGGPEVGERGVVWRSWGRRSWPASDRVDGRLSREPTERAGVAPGPPAPGLCPGGPDDRSATGRRGGGPGLPAGLAGGVSSHPAATLPGPPAGRRAQQVASSLCADPVGAFGPLSAPHDNRFPESVGRRRGNVGPFKARGHPMFADPTQMPQAHFP